MPWSCLLTLTVSPVPQICYMSLTVYHGSWLSLTVCLIPCRCCMSLTVSFARLLSLTVSLSSMELLHVSHCLPFLLAVSHSHSGHMELVHVFHCLLLFLAVSHCLSQCHGYTACLSLSNMFADYLSNPVEFLHVSHCLFKFHGVAS